MLACAPLFHRPNWGLPYPPGTATRAWNYHARAVNKSDLTVHAKQTGESDERHASRNQIECPQLQYNTTTNDTLGPWHGIFVLYMGVKLEPHDQHNTHTVTVYRHLMHYPPLQVLRRVKTCECSVPVKAHVFLSRDLDTREPGPHRRISGPLYSQLCPFGPEPKASFYLAAAARKTTTSFL